MKYALITLFCISMSSVSIAQQHDSLRYDVVYRWVDSSTKYMVGHNLRFYSDDSLIIGTTAGTAEYSNASYFNRINYDASPYYIINDTLSFYIRQNLVYAGIIEETRLVLTRIDYYSDGTERSREPGNVYNAMRVKGMNANLRE